MKRKTTIYTYGHHGVYHCGTIQFKDTTKLQTLAWAANLSNFQFALIDFWLTRICTGRFTAILSTGFCVSAVALFPSFHNLVSTYWLISFDKAGTVLLRTMSIYVLLDAVFAADGKLVIVRFNARCCFIEHDVVSFSASWGTLLCVWIMLVKKKCIIKT